MCPLEKKIQVCPQEKDTGCVLIIDTGCALRRKRYRVCPQEKEIQGVPLGERDAGCALRRKRYRVCP